MAAKTKRFTDREVLVEYHTLLVGQNAETAFSEHLAAICGVAQHRPQMMESLLPPLALTAHCMDVAEIGRFWAYADHRIREDEKNPPAFRRFDKEMLAYYRSGFRSHETSIRRALENPSDNRETH